MNILNQMPSVYKHTHTKESVRTHTYDLWLSVCRQWYTFCANTRLASGILQSET